MKTLFGRLARLGLIATATLTATAALADPVKIRIGWATMPGHMIPVLYSNPSILKHYGKSYVVEPILFRGSTPQITAMAAGEIDMGAFSATSLALAATNAGLDVKVVADIIQDGVDGHHSDAFLVKADSPIKTVEDLKGKRIATNAIGSASDTGMRVMLLNKGMVDKRDFTSIEVAFPNIPAMIEEDKVDMGPVLQPMYGKLVKSGKYRKLFSVSDAVGPSELVFLAARADFLAKNKQAVQDFFEDHVTAIRWFMDPKNKQAGSEIIGKFMKQPPENFAYMFTKEDYFRDPYMVPNVKNIQTMVDASVKAGALPAAFQVAPKYADLTFIEEAKKRVQANEGKTQ
ncbi:ABC transporter substrate-binding protein [Aquabacter spiritensis]|uniref:NitT/TauT family transport system substrate-binding protein n=1 Tax=Aquabacter spiritensis TaxID=933073 RepID=A0A4R3M483_9HYPH|nr:ABC transporter substrate-binding protein [Aquabacter spiritensis]TCT05995.1 NitT/TauT family transport system substrate-binding protein [Aquabacter spiritensis]